ncbi:Hit zinc finger and papa-1-like domain-containing protein [Thalictrum thalictroides]|uniref:Hit zinc finger and papa-1-like domain-containing protein n=1 Tax=Thalictrum thalictroides TaxID=46969 RepID=A0A7J6VTZ2_THATH|nr:Hit zinc finger and papa-1-like domain-containing protein [Thalictrum thalictroides]
MEGFGGSALDASVRKKRSNTSRRPRSDSHPFADDRDLSPPSSKPVSENLSKSSDENNGCGHSSRRKEFNLNQFASRSPAVDVVEGESSRRKSRKDDGTNGGFDRFHSNSNSRGGNEHGRGGSDSKRSSEGVLAPANWKSMNKIRESFDLQQKKPESHSSVVSEVLANENKLRKVKLKVGGVTRTIHAKTSSDFGGSSMRSLRPSEVSRPRPKLILQENSDDDQSPPPGEASGSQGVPLKDFSRGSSSIGKKTDNLQAKTPDESIFAKQTDKFEPTRKSKRVPKPRFLDGTFGDGDEDDEIRYLERFKTSKHSADHGANDEDDEYEGGNKHRRMSSVSKGRLVDSGYDEEVGFGLSRAGRDGKKKPRSEKINEDTDYAGEEDLVSDVESEIKRKKQKKESLDTLIEGKKEMSLTTRQRALQSGKDTTTGSGGSLIEFPNGLPPAPPRKQKEKLSEVEQQLKKAEAAQRRRMQVEKAARESEAEAIRKILGQDSSRKKREDKLKKRRDEIAQEKAASAMTLPPNTIRWVIGPTGTVVTFPQDIGLPSIFSSKPCSYPPPREKCAGPSCTNAYKYRDSKSKLPLCSLQCYKAVKDQIFPISTC